MHACAIAGKKGGKQKPADEDEGTEAEAEGEQPEFDIEPVERYV
jgi:hypothetical protein